MDFDSLPSAERAVKALQSQGVQAQMAKVGESVCTQISSAQVDM